MASILLNPKPVFKTIIQDLFNKSRGVVRTAKSRAKGVGKSEHGRPSRFGIKRGNNQFVTSGTILFNQIKFEVSPGLNVEYKNTPKLLAKVPGRVIVSCEKTNYDSNDALVQKSFPFFIPPYRKYINVIPEPLHRRFKLVEKF